MRSDFAAARHHLEQAYCCLSGDDDLAHKMRAALSLLIDAAWTAEHIANETCKVVMFPDCIPGGRLGRALRSTQAWLIGPSGVKMSFLEVASIGRSLRAFRFY